MQHFQCYEINLSINHIITIINLTYKLRHEITTGVYSTFFLQRAALSTSSSADSHFHEIQIYQFLKGNLCLCLTTASASTSRLDALLHLLHSHMFHMTDTASFTQNVKCAVSSVIMTVTPWERGPLLQNCNFCPSWDRNIRFLILHFLYNYYPPHSTSP